MSAMCRCDSCHRQFSSVTAFDKHRTGEYETRDERGRVTQTNTRRCRSIEELLAIGLFYDEKRMLWRLPLHGSPAWSKKRE